MPKGLLVMLAFLSVGSFVAASLYAGGETAVKPLAYKPPKMVISAPPACSAMLQEYGLGHGHEKTVPMDEYLNFQHRLNDCGGSLTLQQEN